MSIIWNPATDTTPKKDCQKKYPNAVCKLERRGPFNCAMIYDKEGGEPLQGAFSALQAWQILKEKIENDYPQ